MNARRIMILVLLLAAGGLTFFALRPPPPPGQVAGEAAPPPPPPPATVRVITAARTLTPGTLLNETDMTVAEVRVPPPPGAIEATPASLGDFRGSLVRRMVQRGVPIARDDIMHPGERGFLAAVLRPGHRAISIGVDAVTGAAGLVSPGDIVDLVLVQSFAEAPVARRVIAETVLTNLRVIAVDQQVTQGANPAGNRVARTVTLEVTPTAAERVAVAEQLGRLAVTVRAAEEEAVDPLAAAPVPVFGGDVSNVLGSPNIQIPSRMRLIQGGDAQEIIFR